MKKNLLRLTLLSIAVLASFTTAWGEDKVSGEPILIPANPQDTMMLDGVEYQLAIPATEISDVLSSYMDDSTLVEGQVFYLEGGQDYFIRSSLGIYKGLKLTTDPKDLAAGKGRAKVYMNGLAMDGTTVMSAVFILGRWLINDKDADEVIEVENIIFEDIDFDCPLAQNYLEDELGYGTTNYFFNRLFNSHTDIHVKGFMIRNCSFQHFIRGFHRIQGENETTIDNYLVENCEFYNCGGLSRDLGSYGIVCGDPSFNLNTNIFRNMVWRNNTFFDTPIGNFIYNGNRDLQWTDPAQAYNITVENNTFVNFNTVNFSSNAIIHLRNIPIGSTLNINNNLFVQTKQEGDERTLDLMGSYVRYLQSTYEGTVIFNVYNNWSTNDNIDASTGEVFTSNAFSATKSSFGAWLGQENIVSYPHGADELKVHVADISAADLMYQPNPPHKQVGEPSALDHRTDDLEGKGEYSANLYFKDFDNDIVKNNVGASKWRTIVEDEEEPDIPSSIMPATSQKVDSDAIYTLSGQRVAGTVRSGVYIQNGRKVIK